VAGAHGGELPSSARGEERGAAREQRCGQEAREGGRPSAREREGERKGRREERKRRKEKKRKWKMEKEKDEKEREKGERGGGIRAAIAVPGRPRAASGTRARTGASRGSRVNIVMDPDVGVGSFRDREIRREIGLSSTTEKKLFKHFIACFNLVDFGMLQTYPT